MIFTLTFTWYCYITTGVMMGWRSLFPNIHITSCGNRIFCLSLWCHDKEVLCRASSCSIQLGNKFQPTCTRSQIIHRGLISGIQNVIWNSKISFSLSRARKLNQDANLDALCIHARWRIYCWWQIECFLNWIFPIVINICWWLAKVNVRYW